MPDQIYIGNFAKGLKLDRLPFNIDNDAFPTMLNIYSWRGRAKRKRGTSLLGRLTIQVIMVAMPTLPWQDGPLTLSLDEGNLLVFLGLSPTPNAISNVTQATQAVVTVIGNNFSVGQEVFIVDVNGMFEINNNYYTIVARSTNTITLNVDTTGFPAYTLGGNVYVANGPSIVPGTISLTVGANTYTEPATPDGTLIGTPAGTGSINYSTGTIVIIGGGSSTVTGTFSYYPGLPVMGLQDFAVTGTNNLYPLLLAFDTLYSYQINQTSNNLFFYNTTYYKGTNVPFTWSGADYQLFWTTNYSGALWATNGKPGLNLVTGTYGMAGSGSTTITFNFKSGGVNFTTLVVGDILWFNEWNAGGITINGISGTVSDISGAASGNYVVTFLTNQTVSSTGIAQLLTNTIPGQDGIKWYDGDPTGGTGLPTGTGLGWVNFAPPLTASTVSIDNRPPALYYLVGALAILPFKDRLLFFSPIIGTSAGTQFILQDTVLWSWNGTPYYSLPVPDGQTFDKTAYYVDQTGKGGYLPAGLSQPIITVGNNEDVILIGFGGDGRKTRFVYTGNDINPFLFFNINSELPSFSTFSTITLDKGMLDIGQYGIVITDQQSAQRIDLDIPDSVFQIQALQNGVQRVNAARDFFKEWIYFSYPVTTIAYGDGTVAKFPQQTFLFNYRDNTWAIFDESFTRHGRFRHQKKINWTIIGQRYGSWANWREPWNSGANSAMFPSIIAGNAQGYVLIKALGTGEAASGSIAGISNLTGFTQITSTNHCVNLGDYVQILNCIGTIAPNINGQIGKVINLIDANNFVLDILFPIGIYVGLGTFTRLSQPLLMTKQFPVYWDQGRQVRLSVQKYLMDFTANAQVTINIYLSQDPDDVWNNPVNNPSTNGLIYSQILFTCPESTNIGLTPANSNLQMPTAAGQYQIWHRLNTSLIGDTFQIGLTLSDTQMRNLTFATSEITLHGMQLTVDKGPHLS